MTGARPGRPARPLQMQRVHTLPQPQGGSCPHPHPPRARCPAAHARASPLAAVAPLRSCPPLPLLRTRVAAPQVGLPKKARMSLTVPKSPALRTRSRTSAQVRAHAPGEWHRLPACLPVFRAPQKLPVKYGLPGNGCGRAAPERACVLLGGGTRALKVLCGLPPEGPLALDAHGASGGTGERGQEKGDQCADRASDEAWGHLSQGSPFSPCGCSCSRGVHAQLRSACCARLAGESLTRWGARTRRRAPLRSATQGMACAFDAGRAHGRGPGGLCVQ